MQDDLKNGDSTLFDKSVESLRKVRGFAGEPAQFWREFIESAAGVLGARVGVAAVLRTAPGTTDSAWRPIAFAPEALAATPVAKMLADKLAEAGDACRAKGSVTLAADEGNQVLAALIDTGSPQEICMAAFLMGSGDVSALHEKLQQLILIADTPRLYQVNRVASESTTNVQNFAGVLNLMVMLNAEKRFMASAMVFCNEIASRHQCERVSIGWYEKGYIRVKAMSHVENFERKMEAVQKLEAAMEEALDQDEDILLPRAGETGPITRDHEAFLAEHGGKHMCSLPLRLEGEPVAVCTCERSNGAFSPREMILLRLTCDHAIRRIADLKRYDRWFGARFAMGLKDRMAPYLGPEHTWTKAITIAVALLLGFICFARIPYRVEAPFILRTDDLAYITAPFEGHIDKVMVRVSDRVMKGSPMLAFDLSDLLLQEANAVAEENRYARESEKARARGALADMRIADAMMEQASARLELIRYRLAMSTIKAPFSGIVTEGDLMERIGAPVRQGDVLFKLAKVRRLYAELDISEKDIQQVRAGSPGKIAFASRPQDAFGVLLTRVEPVAVSKEDGNTFVARCEFTVDQEAWWRPGMTGVAKVYAGRRTPLWILTHRTVDFLRLRLWW